MTSGLNGIVGQGFDDTELPQMTSVAMHDILVGLTSFDRVYIPLSHAGRTHDLLGQATFWELVRLDVFRFIYFEIEPIVMFRNIDAVDGGDIGNIHPSNPEGKPWTIDQQIRRQLHSAPGQEAKANELFELLAARTATFDKEKFHIPNMARGALLHPEVQRLLGISDAISPNSFPRWLSFPILRLAHTIMAGCACDNFNLPATKLGFGSEILVGAAFSVSAARDWVDKVASYLVSGRFNSDLGPYVEANPSIWRVVLEFRDTQIGTELRRQISQELATNDGAEFVASMNAGLRKVVPLDVMDRAQQELTSLLLRRNQKTNIVPAVWTNLRNSDEISRKWRARSKRELEKHCRKFGLRPKDLCPCNSGEKLRDCCLLALSR